MLSQSVQLTPKQIQDDIKQDKIKEGMMWKRSRYLKEWRERWIVLTKNNLYSFENKQVYNKPTEVLPISEIETLKSYFKHQQEREYSFRAESKNLNFYLAGKTNQQKWAWLSAIERAIDRNQNGPAAEREEPIRQLRNTFISKEQVKALYSRASFIPQPVTVSKKQLTIESLQGFKILASNSSETIQEMKPSAAQGIGMIEGQDTQQAPTRNRTKFKESTECVQTQKPESVVRQKVVEVVVQKIVEVPVVQVVEKIVYVDATTDQLPRVEISREKCLEILFTDVFSGQVESDFLIKFVVSLALVSQLQYSNHVVKVCLFHQQARHFSQALILQYNNETQQAVLNQILKFIILVYQQTEEYFYITDFKVLLDVICRELQLYRSEINHYLTLQLVKTLILKQTWQQAQGYRVEDLKQMITQINNVSPSAQTRDLTKELLLYI